MPTTSGYVARTVLTFELSNSRDERTQPPLARTDGQMGKRRYHPNASARVEVRQTAPAPMGETPPLSRSVAEGRTIASQQLQFPSGSKDINPGPSNETFNIKNKAVYICQPLIAPKEASSTIQDDAQKTAIQTKPSLRVPPQPRQCPVEKQQVKIWKPTYCLNPHDEQTHPTRDPSPLFERHLLVDDPNGRTNQTRPTDNVRPRPQGEDEFSPLAFTKTSPIAVPKRRNPCVIDRRYELKEERQSYELKEERQSYGLKEERQSYELKEERQSYGLKEERQSYGLKEERQSYGLKTEASNVNVIKKSVSNQDVRKVRHLSTCSHMEKKKVVLVGGGNTGKTSMMQAFRREKVTLEHLPTSISEEFLYYPDFPGAKNIQMTVIDTAGQDEYDRFRPLSYPGTNAVIVAFSIDDHTTLEAVLNKVICVVKTTQRRNQLETCRGRCLERRLRQWLRRSKRPTLNVRP